MAIAWFKQFDFVASTIVGATSAGQLDTTLAALDLLLPDEVLQACDKVHQDIQYPMG
jgi:aryl-alcohol dehydrogenase-like predicted oxidoreductase